MLDNIMNMYVWFSEAIKSNQVVAGIFSLWGITVVTFIFIKAPKKIIDFVTKQFTTSIVFNNDNSYDEYSTYSRFNAWFVGSRWAKFSRTLSFTSFYGTEKQNIVFGPGYGFHFFFHNYSFYWFHKAKIVSNGATYREREEITLCTFSRDQRKLYKVIDLFKDNEDDDKISVYVFDDGWGRLTKIPKKNINNIVINKQKKDRILNNIKFFIENKAWYDNSPLPYKITFLLYGPPGGGKTSFVTTLASILGKDIYILNFATLTDKGLIRALSSVPDNSILLGEDVHSCDELCIKEPNDKGIYVNGTALTLSGILNAFGGVIPLDGVITFFTTNYLEKLEPAFYRKGRCDYLEEFGCLESEEINEYIQNVFNDKNYKPRNDYQSIMGCDLESLFMENKYSINSFIEAIPKIHC